VVENSGVGLALSTFQHGRAAAFESSGGGYNIAKTDKLLAEIRVERDTKNYIVVKSGATYEGAVAERGALEIDLNAIFVRNGRSGGENLDKFPRIRSNGTFNDFSNPVSDGLNHLIRLEF
jgi:hypothetical protein